MQNKKIMLKSNKDMFTFSKYFISTIETNTYENLVNVFSCFFITRLYFISVLEIFPLHL